MTKFFKDEYMTTPGPGGLRGQDRNNAAVAKGFSYRVIAEHTIVRIHNHILDMTSFRRKVIYGRWDLGVLRGQDREEPAEGNGFNDRVIAEQTTVKIRNRFLDMSKCFEDGYMPTRTSGRLSHCCIHYASEQSSTQKVSM